MRAVARRDGATRRKHRAQFAQAFHRGVGACALVQADGAGFGDDFACFQVGAAVGHFHRRDLVRELARLLGFERLHVRGVGKFVLRLAGHFPLLGDLFSRQAHAVGNADVLVIGKHGGRQRRRVARHGHHAHRLDTRSNHDFRLTHADAVGRHLHGRQTRGAKTVHADATHAVRQPGQHRANARNVQALRSFRNRTAADDVFNGGRVQRRYLSQRRLQRLDQQVVRPGVFEKATVRAANRCAGGGDDVGVLDLFHGVLSTNDQ